MVETDNSQKITKDYDKIRGIGYSSFVYSLMFSSFLGMATYNIFELAQVDAWISVIIGSIFGIVPLILILYIIKNSNGMNILDLNISLFGKVVGTIINVFLNIFVILFSSLILYNLSLFLDTQFIPDTNSLYVKILLIVPIIYIASKSISTISRVSQFILIANVGLFLLSAIGIIGKSNYNNLLPVMSEGITKPLLGGLQYAIFSTLPLFFLTIIPLKFVPEADKTKITKNVSIMYVVTNVIIFLIFFIITIILGYEVISIYKYPEYMVLKQFSLFNIIERVENTLAVQFVFSMFLLIALSAYFINISLKKTFKKVKSEQLFSYLIGILLLFISSIMFPNSNTATRFIAYVSPYVLAITLSIFIVVTCIGILVRNIKNKASQNQT